MLRSEYSVFYFMKNYVVKGSNDDDLLDEACRVEVFRQWTAVYSTDCAYLCDNGIVVAVNSKPPHRLGHEAPVHFNDVA